MPDGTKGAVALVTRTGPQIGGTANVQLAKLPHGGRGALSLDNAGSFSRITAVIINSDISKSGYSADLGDWVFKKDAQGITLALNDTSAPKIASRSPGTNKKGVSTGSKVSIKFSEIVLGANASTVKVTSEGRQDRQGAHRQQRRERRDEAQAEPVEAARRAHEVHRQGRLAGRRRGQQADRHEVLELHDEVGAGAAIVRRFVNA